MRVASPVLSLLLSSCIVLNPLCAQINSGEPAQPALQSPLQLHVVDDPGRALANSTAAKGYILQVSDSSGNPISSAAVALRLPEEAPTGRFTDSLRAWVAYTNSAGIATFPAIHWLEGAGAVELRATAAKGSMHAGLVIQQQIQPGRVVPPAAAPTPTAALPAPVLKPTIPAGPPVLHQPAPPQIPKISLQAPVPGTVFAPLPDSVPPAVSKSGAAPAKALTPNPPAPGDPKREQTVSIVELKTGAAGGPGHSNKKWWIIGAVGAAAGAGALLALKGHGASTASTATTSSLSIGTPTISVGGQH
jgi:hypothetical protein